MAAQVVETKKVEPKAVFRGVFFRVPAGDTEAVRIGAGFARSVMNGRPPTLAVKVQVEIDGVAHDYWQPLWPVLPEDGA